MGRKLPYIFLELSRNFLAILVCIYTTPETFLISAAIEMLTNNGCSTDLPVKINLNIRKPDVLKPKVKPSMQNPMLAPDRVSVVPSDGFLP